jgi:hypothetical protein
MSTPTVPRLHASGDVPGDVPGGAVATEETLRGELADFLAPSLFPATIDELQASLIRRRAPARLLWCLSRLSPLRRYSCLDAVLSDLDHPAGSDPRGPL